MQCLLAQQGLPRYILTKIKDYSGDSIFECYLLKPSEVNRLRLSGDLTVLGQKFIKSRRVRNWDLQLLVLWGSLALSLIHLLNFEAWTVLYVKFFLSLGCVEGPIRLESFFRFFQLLFEFMVCGANKEAFGIIGVLLLWAGALV